MADAASMVRSQLAVCVLHIGKTGGTALKAVMAEHARRSSPTGVELCNHNMTLMRLRDERPGDKVAFFVRDPVRRFVSGFNSRLRQGRPRYDSRWTRDEELAFQSFRNPTALGEALASPDPRLVEKAEFALNAIQHARRGLAHYLGSREVLEECRDRIVFIGRQETFDEDLKAFQELIGVHPLLESPSDDIGAHRTPAFMEKTLSPQAEASLKDWYRKDYDVLEWCMEHRARLPGLS